MIEEHNQFPKNLNMQPKIVATRIVGPFIFYQRCITNIWSVYIFSVLVALYSNNKHPQKAKRSIFTKYAGLLCYYIGITNKLIGRQEKTQGLAKLFFVGPP